MLRKIRFLIFFKISPQNLITFASFPKHVHTEENYWFVEIKAILESTK